MTEIITSEVGKYSITSPDDAQIISDFIKSLLSCKDTKKITITDATANNGGNTINFAQNFSKVNSVEIDKKEFDILSENVKNFKLKNVSLINDDYLKVMNTLEQDVIFFDPPWGGPNYKRIKNLNLFLGKGKEGNIVNIINKLKKKAKMVVLKVPFNFNYYQLFKFNELSNDYFIKRLLKYIVIFIIIN